MQHSFTHAPLGQIQWKVLVELGPGEELSTGDLALAVDLDGTHKTRRRVVLESLNRLQHRQIVESARRGNERVWSLALGDRTWQILRELWEDGGLMSVEEISEETALHKENVVEHLAWLQDLGLVAYQAGAWCIRIRGG